MKSFAGFSEVETYSRIPDTFFRQLLADISDLAELKVSLYVLWRLAHAESQSGAIKVAEVSAADLGLSTKEVAAALDLALARGTFIRLERDRGAWIVANSPSSRASVGAAHGTGGSENRPRESLSAEPRPNVFRTYEENIGPLTPLIADALAHDEESFSAEWVEQAIGEAARNNKRSLSYVEAILKRWKAEGRVNKQDRRDVEKDGWEELDRRFDELRRRSTG